MSYTKDLIKIWKSNLHLVVPVLLDRLFGYKLSCIYYIFSPGGFVVFSGAVTGGEQGDIAIDDISITRGSCEVKYVFCKIRFLYTGVISMVPINGVTTTQGIWMFIFQDRENTRNLCVFKWCTNIIVWNVATIYLLLLQILSYGDTPVMEWVCYAMF